MVWLADDKLWRGGAWSLRLRGDELADIAFDGRVVLRSVRAVIRDRNWDTASLIVDRVRTGADSLTLSVRSDGLGSSFRGIVRVEARADHLRVICDLETAEDFETNRTGLVVLHPPGLAGTPLRVTHPHGADEMAFPVAISPHQPARDIAGLAWEHDGVAVRVRFEGDTFEMEDQRNWTDASFKTYSRPLALPFPYRIGAGSRVVQTVRIFAERVRDAAARPVADAIVLHESAAPFPEIGVAASGRSASDFGSLTLVELDLGATDWRAKLQAAAASRTALDVRFVLPARDDIDVLADAVQALRGLDVARVAAFRSAGPAAHVSDAEAVAALRGVLAEAGIGVPVVGGSRAHFTELNREHHRLPDELDGLVFSITPLFHALGTEQLIESIAMQRLVARQAVEIAGGKPVHVGPVTLRPRFNNVATGPAEATPSPPVDARQAAPELAAWAIASVAALSVPGVASLVYFDDATVSDDHGEPLPAAVALAALASQSGRLLHGESPDGLVWAVGARRDDEAVIVVANLDGRERTLTVHGAASAEFRLAAFTWQQVTLPFGRVEA